MRAAKAISIILAAGTWFATHTSFATETIHNGGAGGSGLGIGVGKGVGIGGGATAHGGNVGPVTGGSTGGTRAYALGLSSAVSPATCYGTILGGGGVVTQDDCLRFQWHQRMLAQAAATDNAQMYRAARLYLCGTNDEVARAMRAAGFDDCPRAGGPRGPVFQTGAEGDHGYGAYRWGEN